LQVKLHYIFVYAGIAIALLAMLPAVFGGEGVATDLFGLAIVVELAAIAARE
jgi:hypothetical protein